MNLMCPVCESRCSWFTGKCVGCGYPLPRWRVLLVRSLRRRVGGRTEAIFWARVALGVGLAVFSVWIVAATCAREVAEHRRLQEVMREQVEERNWERRGW